MARGGTAAKQEAGLSIFHIASRRKAPALLGILISPLILAGCNQTTGSISTASLTESLKPGFMSSRTYGYNSDDRECLARAMFFESNRSSREGMVAVGTVVMNRLRSGNHGETICSVVGEKRQFAPGVLSRPMNSKALPDVMAAADAVLKGERAPKLKNAMHFHTAGLKFPYKNMHYVEVAGGNAFYEKRGRNWQPLPSQRITMIALNGSTPSTPAAAATETMVASADTLPGVNGAENGTATTQLAAAAPLPTPRTTVVAVADATPKAATREAAGKQARAIQVAMQEPDSARFGDSGFDTARPSSVPFMTAAADDAPTLSFQSTPADTDAVAALIMSENRPGQ